MTTASDAAPAHTPEDAQAPDFAQTFDALLFDMDGTVLSSVAVVNRVWGEFARRFGLDPEPFIARIHGVRGIDTLRSLNLPGLVPEVEAAALERAELDDLEGVEEIAGAGAFLRALPPDRWAIVTSASRELAGRRLAAAGLPVPAVFVTAEDVARGKPDPACFRLAAERLGFDPGRCLVFEDAEAGVRAGEAAGATVVVVTATHGSHPTGGRAQLAHYGQIRAEAGPQGLRIRPA